MHLIFKDVILYLTAAETQPTWRVRRRYYKIIKWIFKNWDEGGVECCGSK
jgi:hypothetical protein